MDAKGQLERMLRIQELVLEIREAETVIETAPSRIDEIETHFRERNAEYVAVRDQFEEIEEDRKTRTGALSAMEEQREKFKAGLMDVKNQREYAAVLKEIDAVKAEISANEEAILKDMEALETLKGELANHEEHITKERAQVETDRTAVHEATKKAQAALETLAKERAATEKGLPHGILARITTLERGRQGVFLSKADNGTCLSCFVRMRPQVFQEVKVASKIHPCSNCRRFLYYEPLMNPEAAAAEAAATEAATESTDAVNGGAV